MMPVGSPGQSAGGQSGFVLTCVCSVGVLVVGSVAHCVLPVHDTEDATKAHAGCRNSGQHGHSQLLSLHLSACTDTRPCCARQADAVTGRTTNFQRTIGTLQGVLTGLYPDTLEAIPVTTAADLDEVLFANVQGCLSLKLAMDAAKKKVQGESVWVQQKGRALQPAQQGMHALWQ